MEAFFERLAALRGRFEVRATCVDDRAIRMRGRRSRHGSCPVCGVANEGSDVLFGDADIFEAGGRAGLTRREVASVARAADGSPGHDPAIRKRLLDTLGLEEQ